MKLTKEQWNEIDELVQARAECSCKPICEACLEVMDHTQELHTQMSRSRTSQPSTSNTQRSKSLMWYEVTFTFPDKDKKRAAQAIEKLKKYSKYSYIDGRFEIGKKNGLYHMHFLIKTNKYLRLREIKACNANKVTHLTQLKGKDGLKFQNYIQKDANEIRPEGWDFNFSEVIIKKNKIKCI